jgi:signal transduction histidine kinase
MSRFFERWLGSPGRIPTWASVLMGLAMLSAAGYFDWVTGPQIALSLIYVVPITWITWQGGRWMGLAMCCASGGIWLWVELEGHLQYDNAFVPYWNATVRLILFILISSLESEVMERKKVERGLRQAKEELEERAAKLAKSEADLQAQTNVLQSILSSMGDGVVVADAAGRLMHINPAALRMLQIPAAGEDVMRWLATQENYLLSSPGEKANGGNPLLRAACGEAVDGVEMYLRQPDAPNGVWLSVSGRPLVDQTGTVAGGVVVLGDISFRKNLERQIAEVSDREQRRLGEDLHDGLCQYLVSIAFAARKLAARLREESKREAAEADQIAELLGESIAQARAVARGLYLVPLEVGGLRSALEEFLMQVRSRHRLACQLVDRVLVPIVGEIVVTNLFRIAQEAVNNSLKHAEAASIVVTLTSDKEQILLTIEDDGKGIPLNLEQGRGLGLHLMNYRARMLGAALLIHPRAGGGTVVACVIRRDSITSQESHVEAG